MVSCCTVVAVCAYWGHTPSYTISHWQEHASERVLRRSATYWAAKTQVSYNVLHNALLQCPKEPQAFLRGCDNGTTMVAGTTGQQFAPILYIIYAVRICTHHSIHRVYIYGITCHLSCLHFLCRIAGRSWRSLRSRTWWCPRFLCCDKTSTNMYVLQGHGICHGTSGRRSYFHHRTPEAHAFMATLLIRLKDIIIYIEL